MGDTRTITRPVELTLAVHVITCSNCGVVAKDPEIQPMSWRALEEAVKGQPIQPDLEGWWKLEPLHHELRRDQDGNMYRWPEGPAYLCRSCVPAGVTRG